MTSKEALQSIRDYHNETVYDIDNIYTENMFEKELDIIEKDLEVLEIIKDVFNYKSVQKFVDNLSGEDLIKVSRWFENDK